MPLQIQFQLSLDDYLAAQRLHEKRGLWPRFISILNNYLYPLMGLLSFACGLLLIGRRASTGSVLILFVCGIILLCCPLYIRMRLKRCYKRTRSGNGECTLNLDEEFIRIDGEYTHGEIGWKAVKSFRENEKLFLLYTAPAMFIAIPKRACSEAQVNELRTILQQKVHPTIR
ncbi:MAG: YcxB family protein [Terracidiphilus sp.]|nr:YcxB family protein [Terracidiphilus sp.]